MPCGAKVMRRPQERLERLEHHQSDWLLGVLHTVQYRCVRTMSQKGDHESRVKRAEVVCQQYVRYQTCHCCTIKVAEQLLHTTVHLTIFEKCPNVAHEPQYCNLRTTAVANIDTICKAQAIAQPPWSIAQITHARR